MTAAENHTFSLPPETMRRACVWIGGWVLLAALCTPTLFDGVTHVGQVSQRSCLIGLISLWIMPLVSACAVYGPRLVDRILAERPAEVREQVSTVLVIVSTGIGVLTILPATGFVVLLAFELIAGAV